MENIVVSQNSLFWNKLGKWQVLAVVLSLVIFFVYLRFVDDKRIAVLGAGNIVFGVYVVLALFANHASDFVGLAMTTAMIVTGIVMTIFVLPTSIEFPTYITAIFSIPIVALVAVSVIAIIRSAKKCNLRKRVIWLSFATEFFAIFFPMWLVYAS